MESKYNKSENANDNSLNIGKNNQIEIYNYSGKKLNLSICNEDIKIMKYIGDIEKLDIESAMNLADKGIDVFNASDKFFNDLCHYYDNKDGKDIIITDRRNDIYQNVTFRQNGCEYMGMDYDLMAANCSCDTYILQNTELNNVKEGENSNKEKFNFDDLKKSFISNLYDFNYRVMYCHNLVINLNILKKNIGFYSMISLLIFQIIFLIIYIIKGLNSIKQDIFNFKFKKGKNNLMFPPPKNNNKIENNTKYNFNNNNDQNEKDNIYSIERKNDNSKSNIKLAIKNMDEPYLDKNTIKSDRKQIKDKISKNNKRQLKPKKSLFKKKIKKKKKQKMETTEEKNQKNKFNNNNIKIKELYISNDKLQNMDYKQAIIYDKRSYIKMYWSFLVDSQLILGTFFTDNYLNLFVVNFSFLICTFQISFFLNAFSYTDEYISDAYHNDGVLDFITSLPKTVYSFILTFITTNLLSMLSNSKKELQNVINKNKKNNYSKISIKNKLKKLRIKLIIYFVLVFLLGIFFSYYVMAFCAVYRNSQKYWFYGCLESFVLDSLFSFITCLFLALFRYISIRKRKVCLYNTVNIITNFL